MRPRARSCLHSLRAKHIWRCLTDGYEAQINIASGLGKFMPKGRNYLTLFFLHSARPQMKTTGAFTQKNNKKNI